MLAEVPRSHRAARTLLARNDGASALTLGQFAAPGRFPPYCTAHFLTPMVSAVWSCDPVTATRYPAHHLFRFMDHTAMRDQASGKAIRASGCVVGCLEPPAGSTVMPMPEAPSTGPSSSTVPSGADGSISPAERMLPLSSNHSW